LAHAGLAWAEQAFKEVFSPTRAPIKLLLLYPQRQFRLAYEIPQQDRAELSEHSNTELVPAQFAGNAAVIDTSCTTRLRDIAIFRANKKGCETPQPLDFLKIVVGLPGVEPGTNGL
jgi:hypothetical protein